MMSKISAAQANLYNAKIQYQREMTSPKRDDISAMPGFGVPAMMDQYMTRPMADMMGTNDSSVNKHADLVNSQTGVAQARFNLQQAMAALQSIDASLRDAKTIAPFNGIILKKMVEVGDTLQPGQPLVNFGYVKEMQLRADVPSALVLSLKSGMEVSAKIAGKAAVKATVAEIHPIADPERHTIVVKFDLPAGTKASSGMYAEVMLPLSSSKQGNSLSIPASALLKGRSLPSVLLIQDKTSVLRLVRLGSAQDNGLLEVVSGLTAGDKIINNPPSGVSSGWLPQ
jgi:RND family efflux transporter MFP subunit